MMKIAATAIAVSMAAAASVSAQQTQEQATPIQQAPCDWFTKTTETTWGTNHTVIIDPPLAISKLSVGRGAMKMTDGRDVYGYLEQKCGEE